jgi:hypothetical protein
VPSRGALTGSLGAVRGKPGHDPWRRGRVSCRAGLHRGGKYSAVLCAGRGWSIGTASPHLAATLGHALPYLGRCLVVRYRSLRRATVAHAPPHIREGGKPTRRRPGRSVSELQSGSPLGSSGRSFSKSNRPKSACVLANSSQIAKIATLR